MRILNLQYRGIDRTTDVLSFPLLSADELKNRIREASSSSGKLPPSKLRPPDDALPLGDIVINLHQARRQAEEYGVTFNDELKRLLIHGLLHLIGYDHEQGFYLKKKMEKKEQELLRSS
jgi:probable rRNA maturation factor